MDRKRPSRWTSNRPSGMANQPHRLFNNIDCLRYIFSFLNLRDRSQTELVSKEWQNLSSDVPLPPSALSITCDRGPPSRFCIKFSGRMGFLRFVPFRSESTANGANPDDANIKRAMNVFFDWLFSTYGYAISDVIFGGDTYRVHGLEAATTDYPVPLLQPILLRNLADFARNRLRSISLRGLLVSNETWPILGNVIEILAGEGRLQTLCLHDVTADGSSQESQSELYMPFAMSLNRLKRFTCSMATLPMLLAIGDAATIVERERAENRQRPRLGECLVRLQQNYLVVNRLPDTSYLSAVKAGDVVDLELNINDYRRPGISAAVAMAFQLAGYRLRMLDLRLWIPAKSQYYRRGDPKPIVDILPDLDPVIDSIQEFRLYGSEACLNDDVLSVLVATLSMAPNLRRLSLGKVGGLKLKNLKPLGNLIQLEWLFLSSFPKLNNTQLVDILDRLVNLSRLYLMEVPLVTNSAIMCVIGRLEAFEITICHSFNIKRFFQEFLESRMNLVGNPVAEAAMAIDRLEFVKIRNCSPDDLRFLKRDIYQFGRLGIQVKISFHYCEAIFVLKNHRMWDGVNSIRLPWYNCQYCEADLSP